MGQISRCSAALQGAIPLPAAGALIPVSVGDPDIVNPPRFFNKKFRNAEFVKKSINVLCKSDKFKKSFVLK